MGGRHHGRGQPARGRARLLLRSDKTFIGSEALVERSIERRLHCIVLEDPRSVTLGNEPVRVGGAVRGRVTTGGYGYTVARSLAYAYLPADVETGTEVEIDVFGGWLAGQVVTEPLYDLRGERVRVSTGRPAG